MKPLRYIIIYVSALLVCGSVVAQSETPTIESYLSADTITIGDRVTLTVEVEKDVMQVIAFPTFDFSRPVVEGEVQPSEEPSVEVVVDYAPDTIRSDGRRVRLRKRYEMAIYDEGIYNLGRVKALYLDKNLTDTITAPREESIVVLTYPIDSTMVTVRGLKPQKTLKFRFAEISGYLAIALGVALLVALLVYLFVRYMHKRGKRVRDIFKPAPPVPAHIVAIGALEKLRDEKLWQNNKHKLYYSRLSDILRTYLAGRFEVGAMEMTTDEIMEAVDSLDIEPKQRISLLEVLKDSDLVKFAKVEPAAEENELAYDRAYYFVEETKPVEVLEGEGADVQIDKKVKEA